MEFAVGGRRFRLSLHVMPATHAVEVERLVREFKRGPRAVDGIDLFVEPGEIHGFLGPNGAGSRPPSSC